MASDSSKGAGGKVRSLLVYAVVGAGIFAMTAAWVFTGLRLWGR